jgi:hypothetical protein
MSMRSGTILTLTILDVEVIGSLLLVRCVLLPRAVCLFLSLSLSLVSLCRRDKFVAQTHSYALTVEDTGRKL